MGNSDPASNGGHITSIPGLAENAAATMGRLAKVSPSFVAVDLGRFLHGWYVLQITHIEIVHSFLLLILYIDFLWFFIGVTA